MTLERNVLYTWICDRCNEKETYEQDEDIKESDCPPGWIWFIENTGGVIEHACPKCRDFYESVRN